MSTHKKAAAVAAQRAMIANQPPQGPGDNKRLDADQPMRDAAIDEDPVKKGPSVVDTTESPQTSLGVTQSNTDATHTPSSTGQPSIGPTPPQNSNDATPQPRQPWDHVDEILNLMKTGHPLLVLTIETMVDQILQRFKASAEEEIYRLVCMLLVDAVQVVLSLTAIYSY
jgi:transformation/transcription domain-associated protein